MNNNIEFSIMPNKAHTKFKIAWTIKIGEYPITRKLSREHGSEEAAQKYLDKNREALTQKIREKISKIMINIKEEKEEEVKPEETVEETVAEVTMPDDEIVDEGVDALLDLDEEKNNEIDLDDISAIEEDNEDEVAISMMMETNGEEGKDEENEPEEEMVPRNNKKKHLPRRIIAFLLAAIISFLAGYHAYKLINKDSDEDILEPGIESPVNPGTEDEEKVLTTEEFETLAANFVKTLQDKELNVTTEDITKFVSIVNIDRLVEENPELVKTLFSTTAESYILDSASVKDKICMYNAKVFEEEKSTENFVRISDTLYGEEKEEVMEIESYVDKIAKVYYDAEQVNALVAELASKLLTGDMQNLDYGVQFAIQASIEMIRSYIAKDVLTETNSTLLATLTRLDVTEIIYMYNNVQGLNGTSKTLK